MRLLRICLALTASLLYAAEEGTPKIAGVSASYLAPGAILKMAGERLGPTPGCEAKADPVLLDTPNPRNPDLADPLDSWARNTWVYPKELCGVRVLINDEPAGLAWVSATQINLKLPQDSPENGTASLRVVYQGKSSDPLLLPAGWGKTTVELAEPAYVGMPVWLKVTLRYGLGRVTYPAAMGRAGFCNQQVEVRRNGVLLPMLEGSNWSMAFGGMLGGPMCGWIAPRTEKSVEDRLPLHLLYRFDTPGTYEVRYTLPDPTRRFVAAQSDWTPIEILPANPRQRTEYLDAMRKRVTSDPGEIVTDVLPSVLGFPDDETFAIVTSYLNHPLQAVRRYALAALSYWPKESTRERLLELLRRDGPTEELVRFLLLGDPEFAKARGAEVLAESVKHLESDSEAAIDGAITALQLTQTPRDRATFEMELRAADRILGRRDIMLRNMLLDDLMSANSPSPKDPRVRALLLRLEAIDPSSAAFELARFGN